MQLNKFALAVALAVSGGAASAATELVTNGDFIGGLSGWNSPGSATPVDWLGGVAVFDMNTDLLRQSISFTAGQQYLLSFQYSTSGAAGYGFQWDLNGAAEDTGGWENLLATNGAWMTKTYSFTADATGNSRLRFSGAGNKDALLDGVSITAVPEPETYAMMLAGLGAIGFMARRRQAK